MSYASQLGTFSVTIRKRFLSISLPILICSVLSGVCSWIIFGYFTGDFGGDEIPQAEIGGSPYITAIVFVAIAFVGSTGIFLIIKYSGIKVLKAIFAVAILVTSFFFVFLIIFSTPYYILDLTTDNTVFSNRIDLIILSLSIIGGAIFALITILSMVYQIIPKPIPQIMAVLFAVLSGTFLATFLPTLAAILVMIGLSIYDIISVFKGPIKKIAEITEERYNEENNNLKATEKEPSSIEISSNEELSLETDNTDSTPETRVDDSQYIYVDYIELGLGDLAFFGMLFSFALIKLGLYSAIAAFVGVIIGSIFTIRLLSKAKMMPGLPISIGLGLIFAFGVWGILKLVGFTGWGWIDPVWF
ncbi:MAG: hypothetical protein JXA54_14805 [Candidatus Heimdallarchaeota archaeon]|nr:hypothetical protein [Candidatus Heimdallarchaeota archaeon]